MAILDAQLAIPLAVPVHVRELGVGHDGVEPATELGRRVALDLSRRLEVVLKWTSWRHWQDGVKHWQY